MKRPSLRRKQEQGALNMVTFLLQAYYGEGLKPKRSPPRTPNSPLILKAIPTSERN